MHSLLGIISESHSLYLTHFWELFIPFCFVIKLLYLIKVDSIKISETSRVY